MLKDINPYQNVNSIYGNTLPEYGPYLDRVLPYMAIRCLNMVNRRDYIAEVEIIAGSIYEEG